MGAVIALKKNGRVYVATDRMRTRMGYRWIMKNKENLKIERIGKDIILGVCGRVCTTQNLSLHPNWFRVPKGMEFDKRFLATCVVPRLIGVLKAKELLEKNDEGEPFMDDLYLIVKGERIFIIDNDFGVVEAQDLAIISDDISDYYLRGYIDNHQCDDPETFLREAFVKCAQERAKISNRIVITDTENEEFRFYGEDM